MALCPAAPCRGTKTGTPCGDRMAATPTFRPLMASSRAAAPGSTASSMATTPSCPRHTAADRTRHSPHQRRANTANPTRRSRRAAAPRHSSAFALGIEHPCLPNRVSPGNSASMLSGRKWSFPSSTPSRQMAACPATTRATATGHHRRHGDQYQFVQHIQYLQHIQHATNGRPRQPNTQ